MVSAPIYPRSEPQAGAGSRAVLSAGHRPRRSGLPPQRDRPPSLPIVIAGELPAAWRRSIGKLTTIVWEQACQYDLHRVLVLLKEIAGPAVLGAARGYSQAYL
jgi:hypothetical protein